MTTRRTFLFLLLLSLFGWGIVAHLVVQRSRDRAEYKAVAVAVCHMLAKVRVR